MADKIRKKWMDKTKQSVDLMMALPKLELAYLAGIVDGEGTISMRKMTKGYYRPILEIVNTDELLITWLSKLFWQKPTEAFNGTGRRYLRIHLTGFGIAPILKALEPHLISKKLQSQLLQRYIKARMAQVWREKPTDEMEELFKDIRLLNSVGAGSELKREGVRKKYNAEDENRMV